MTRKKISDYGSKKIASSLKIIKRLPLYIIGLIIIIELTIFAVPFLLLGDILDAESDYSS